MERGKMCSLYARLRVKNPHIRRLGRTGRFLKEIYFHKGREITTRQLLKRNSNRQGNDHNALMQLKNGGLITGVKRGGRWHWQITAKGIIWFEKHHQEIGLDALLAHC